MTAEPQVVVYWNCTNPITAANSRHLLPVHVSQDEYFSDFCGCLHSGNGSVSHLCSAVWYWVLYFHLTDYQYWGSLLHRVGNNRSEIPILGHVPHLCDWLCGHLIPTRNSWRKATRDPGRCKPVRTLRQILFIQASNWSLSRTLRTKANL